MNRRTLLGLGLLAGVGAIGGGAAWAAFNADLAAARARLFGRSTLVETRFGTVEYAIEGGGPPVLMIHGSGGGFDQGLAFAHPLVRAGYRVIAPSRFGYLRSSFPPEPSSENQADALADLLDHLEVARAYVIGGSAGALSALQFAIRHPNRCAALLPIVPASFAPNRPPELPLSPLAGAIMDHALQSDVLFWLGLKAAPDAMTRTLLATDPSLVAAASADERARVHGILWSILPVSARAEGLRNDGKLAGDPAPAALDRISAPTLAISLEDDRFGTFAAAQHIAANVRGARLLSYTTGGHVWVGHNADMFAAIDAFLQQHALGERA